MNSQQAFFVATLIFAVGFVLGCTCMAAAIKSRLPEELDSLMAAQNATIDQQAALIAQLQQALESMSR